MKIIAITGKSGSGKSTVSQYYKSLGYCTVDCDEVAKHITDTDKQCLEELVSYFGNDILNDDATLNRKVLADKAFYNKQSTEKLISITHPAIIKEIFRIIESSNSKMPFAFVDGAVIVGEMFEKYCDKIIVVLSSAENSIKRITLRDNITKEDAAKRLNAQMSDEKLKSAADYIIYNDGSNEDLIAKANKVLSEIRNEVS